MDDVFELRSDSKASFYTPFTELSLSPTNHNLSPSKQAYNRSNSLSGKQHKKLPPLAKSVGGSVVKPIDYTTLDLVDLNSSNANLKEINNINGFLKIRNHNRPSSLSRPNTGHFFPDTENKKRPPQKIQSIDSNIQKRVVPAPGHLITNFAESQPVTIDILSESGRYSRQSLEPINFSERSRFSSRPNSVKEPLFRKNSAGKLTLKMNDQDVSNSNNLENYEDENDYSEYINIESCYDDSESVTNTNEPANVENSSNNISSNSIMTKSDLIESNITISKLDTIDESISETMRSNIKKLNLIEKPEVVPRQSVVSRSVNNVSRNSFKSATSNCKKQSFSNEKALKANKPLVVITPSKTNSVSNNSKINTCNPVKHCTARTKSIERNIIKPKLNLDLFTPTSNNNKQVPTKPILPQATQLQPNSASALKSTVLNGPTQIESTRINKKNTEPTVKLLESTTAKQDTDQSKNKPQELQEKKNSEIIVKPFENGTRASENVSEEKLSKIDGKMNDNVPLKTRSVAGPTQIETSRINKKNSDPIIQPLPEPPIIKIDSPSNNFKVKPVRQESDETIREEMNSMIDVNEMCRSNVSSATSRSNTAAYSNRSSRIETSINSSHLGQPGQPVINIMFEDLPQPFTSKSINNQSNDDLNAVKKKKPNVSYSKKQSAQQNKNRTISANNRANKPKTPGKPVITKSNNKSPNIGQNYEIQLKNEISMYIDSDLNANKNIADYEFLSENEDNKLSVSMSNIAKSEPDLRSKSLSQSQSQIDLNEYSIKLKSELVRSVAEKVEAIYNKYNDLINKQENVLIDSKKSLEQQTKELNEQKAHFSEEMADELEKNINFDEVSSDPDLVKRLKEVYVQVKQNLSKTEEKPSIDTHSPVHTKPESPDPSMKLTSESNTLTIPGDTTLKRTNSIRSNADIREVFSIVNGLSRHSSMNNTTSNKIDLEMTFPPVNHNRAKVILTNKNIYQIPNTLTDKINTLITTFQSNSKEKIEYAENGNSDDQDEEKKNTLTEGNDVNHENKKFDTLDRKLRFNYTNSLGSAGNESINSIDSDFSNISYHYDVKYRNDGSKSPVNLLMENENDFQFKWKRGNLIGKGAFGSVFQAMLSTGSIIAVKQIEMEESDPNKARKEYDNVREEVKILRELNHINIVQFMGTMLEGKIVNIFMELIPGGTIEFLLKTYGPFEEDLFRNFTNQILEGINYIHSRNVVHRDIKGKNIMVMGNGVVKLIDFGCAKRLKKNQSSNSIKQLLKSLKGTPYWMSPEVIREVGHGSKADIWSTGATVFEMSTGSPPWAEYQPIAAIYRIGSGDTPIPELPSKFSAEARDFVSKCLIRNPDERPSAAELLQHDFMRQNPPA